MKKLLFTLALLAPLTLSAAITEIYVSAAGGGTHDGSTEGNAFSWAEMITQINAGGKAGNRYNYKGDIARTTTTDAISGSGTIAAPVIIRGYTTTIGDGYQGRTNSNNGLIPTNFPKITYTTGVLNVTGNFLVFESLSISFANNAAAFNLNAADCTVHWCAISNAATGTGGIPCYSLGDGTSFIDCDFTLTNGGGVGTFALGGYSFRAVACYIKSASVGVKINTGTKSTFIYGSTIFNCATAVTNVALNGHLTMANCTIADCTQGITVINGASASSTAIVNCMITDISGNGIFVGTDNQVILSNNRFRNNGTNINGAADWASASDWEPVTTGSTTDYVNASSGNYNLATGSPGRGVGIPRFRDLGALQSTNAVGSSTGGSFTWAQ